MRRNKTDKVLWLFFILSVYCYIIVQEHKDTRPTVTKWSKTRAKIYTKYSSWDLSDYWGEYSNDMDTIRKMYCNGPNVHANYQLVPKLKKKDVTVNKLCLKCNTRGGYEATKWMILFLTLWGIRWLKGTFKLSKLPSSKVKHVSRREV